jgi:hypothetical protein
MNTITNVKSVNAPVFEVRALPRKRKPQEDEQPLFLRKVFTMITNCPPAIGGWCDHGETFVIKDADKFAEVIIPTAFKHSKFASFVRQLNFYGFRKVRPDAVSQAHWWEFRHPYFKRDEPELIAKIKKSVHFDSNGQPVIVKSENGATVEGSVAGETAALELETMRTRMSQMEDRISELTGLVQLLLASKGNVAEPAVQSNPKKRKLSASAAAVAVDQQKEGVTPSFSMKVPEDTFSWDEMESKFLDDASFDSMFPLGDLMTPLAVDELGDISSFEDMPPATGGINNDFMDVFDESATFHTTATAVEAYPMANSSLLAAHPLADPAAMVGMVDLMARTLGTVASMCHTATAQQFANGQCSCANCKMLTIYCGASNQELSGTSMTAQEHTSVQVPAVVYPLLAASIGALAVKYGDTLFTNRSTPAPVTQDSR